jgi:hypothetical protein
MVHPESCISEMNMDGSPIAVTGQPDVAVSRLSELTP